MFEHFVSAQGSIYPRVVAELRAGEKRSHWMWFIFPQLAGLGHSERAIRYGIADLETARAYLGHPALGSRLRECTALVNQIMDRTAHDIFGSPDDAKFRSSMTLFSRAAPASDGDLFRAALARYCHGAEDALTLRLLGVA
jgi:uncharacterized protein (DUF1810 family)